MAINIWKYSGMHFYYPSNSSNVTLKCFVYLSTESHQIMLTLYSSIALTYFTDLLLQMPSVWIIVQYLYFVFEITQYIFKIIWLVHHAKSGSVIIFLIIAYSTNWTGYHLLMYLKFSHMVIPPLQILIISTLFLFILFFSHRTEI